MSKELLEQTVRQTVNVIMVNKESFSPSIIGTFEDNSAGNIFAEELFIKIVRSNHESPILEDEIEPLLDDSYYENDKVQIAISHSLNEFDNLSMI